MLKKFSCIQWPRFTKQHWFLVVFFVYFKCWFFYLLHLFCKCWHNAPPMQNHQKIYRLAEHDPIFCKWGVLFNFQAGETNIRSGLCWGHATNVDHEMISCLSCIPFKLSSQLPAERQTCMNKAKSEWGAVTQTSWWINSSLHCVSCLPLSCLLFLPPCCCTLGESRWSSTGYNVCWGRRKRRIRTSSRPALLQQWG